MLVWHFTIFKLKTTFHRAKQQQWSLPLILIELDNNNELNSNNEVYLWSSSRVKQQFELKNNNEVYLQSSSTTRQQHWAKQ